ncbi:RNase H domain-containing protein [Trichonephila clavipes]|nr:RNase H domain-containing protein [Trichonephila clavipes]
MEVSGSAFTSPTLLGRQDGEEATSRVQFSRVGESQSILNQQSRILLKYLDAYSRSAILSQDNFAIAYTDGSSDRSLSNGCAGIILLLPDGNNYKHKINTGIIASNFTCELMAIREALILYQQDPHVIDSTEGLVIFSDSKSAIEAIRNGESNISCDIITLLEQLHNKRKRCILQLIPAHANIEGHEDSPRQDKIICSMQTLPRSSTHAQSHLGMPNRRNKVTKNGNGPSEGLFEGTPVQP